MTTWAELELALEPEDAAPLEAAPVEALLELLLLEEVVAALTVVLPADTDCPSDRLTSTTVPAMGEVSWASAKLLLA
jgi:hypothetical protein